MKLFNKSKDGGSESPVDAFFLFEIKSIGSIALLKFNEGGREAFHTHAFNAFTWFLTGDLVEETLDTEHNTISYYFYRRSLLPKLTHREKNHRVYAYKTSWCFTIRGPWSDTWTEDTGHEHTVLTHGRKVIERTSK